MTNEDCCNKASTMEPNGRQGWHDIFTVHMRLFMTLKMHEMNIWIEWISHNKWHCPYIRRIRFKSVWQHPPSRLIFLHTADFVCSREATLLFWPLTSLRCRKTSLSLLRIWCTVAAFCFTFRWWVSQFLMIQIFDHRWVLLGSAAEPDCDLQHTDKQIPWEEKS